MFRLFVAFLPVAEVACSRGGRGSGAMTRRWVWISRARRLPSSGAPKVVGGAGIGLSVVESSSTFQWPPLSGPTRIDLSRPGATCPADTARLTRLVPRAVATSRRLADGS